MRRSKSETISAILLWHEAHPAGTPGECAKHLGLCLTYVRTQMRQMGIAYTVDPRFVHRRLDSDPEYLAAIKGFQNFCRMRGLNYRHQVTAVFTRHMAEAEAPPTTEPTEDTEAKSHEL